MSYNCRTGTVQCLITAVQVLHNIRTSKDVKTWTENNPCPGKSTAGFGTCSATRTDEAKVGSTLKHGKPQLLSSSSPSSPESLRQLTSYSSAASKSAAILSLADMEYREDEVRVQEEIRFHKENPNTCEFCKKKCDVNVDMMEKCVVTGGTHSIPHY